MYLAMKFQWMFFKSRVNSKDYYSKHSYKYEYVPVADPVISSNNIVISPECLSFS
jgi:hypothetical protein